MVLIRIGDNRGTAAIGGLCILGVTGEQGADYMQPYRHWPNAVEGSEMIRSLPRSSKADGAEGDIILRWFWITASRRRPRSLFLRNTK
jgi:hypothetical protein